MERPVHHDLAKIEREARKAFAQGNEQMRERNRAKGAPDFLTDAQAIMSEVVIAAAIAGARAENEGCSTQVTAFALGAALCCVIDGFHVSHDPDYEFAEAVWQGFRAASRGFRGADVGITFEIAIAPVVGGNA